LAGLLAGLGVGFVALKKFNELGDSRWIAIEGEVYLAENDIEMAEPLLKKAILERGVLPSANVAYGKLLMLKADYENAITVLSPLIQLPRYARDTLVPLTTALIKSGRLKEAQLHLERPLFKELAEYADLLSSLAKAYEKRGQVDNGRKISNILGDSLAGPPFWQRYSIVYEGSNAVILGGGRMGRVYLGRQREDNQMVAIREIPLMAYSDTLLMKRFKKEVDLMGRLEHENVVSLLGHALLEGKCLMALEYSRAGTLADKLKDSAQDLLLWADMKAIILSVLSGLEYLHSLDPQIVHRNLKPSNILFFDDNVCKITDFAFSRLLDSPVTSVVTSVEEQSSSYRYMAPEVILGSASTAVSADIYSAGVCFYELLTGQVPFDYKDVDAQIRAHLKEKPRSLSIIAQWIPAELDMIILSMLEKVPHKRPLSCTEVIEAIGRL